LRWFKHKNESLNDPDISDLIDEFGGDGYMVFFGTLELISRNWKQSVDGKVTFSIKFLRKNFRISSQRLHNIFTFQKFYKRICSEFSEKEVTLFCPDFVDLLDNWSDREVKKEQVKLGSNSVVTTQPRVEEEGEVENIKEEVKEETLFPLSSDEQKINNPTPEEIPYQEIVDYFNLKTKKKIKAMKEVRTLIHARWVQGHRVEQFKLVIDNQVRDWAKDSKMATFLRPSTLFSEKHFQEYANNLPQDHTPKEGVYI